MDASMDNDTVQDDSSQPDSKSQRFQEQGVDVKVSSAPGYLCKIRMKAIVDMPATEVFMLFTNPDNSSIFRQIDKTIKHNVVRETDELREVEVEQESTVGALWFKATFTTALNVVERKDRLESSFSLARPGMMANFAGHWQLSNWTGGQDVSAAMPSGKPGDAAGSAEAADEDLSPRDANVPVGQCLMYLEQDVAPAIAKRVPGMFHGILRRVCANACVGIYQDLQTCAALRHRGMSIHELLTSKVHGRGGLHHKLGKLQYVPATGGLQRPQSHDEKVKFLTRPVPPFGPPSTRSPKLQNAPNCMAFHIDDVSTTSDALSSDGR